MLVVKLVRVQGLEQGWDWTVGDWSYDIGLRKELGKECVGCVRVGYGQGFRTGLELELGSRVRSFVDFRVREGVRVFDLEHDQGRGVSGVEKVRVGLRVMVGVCGC